MVVVENQFTTPVACKLIWRALTDLERYAVWHPSLRLDGVATLGGEFGLVQTNTVIGRDAPRVPARVTRLEPERVIAWRMGLRPLLQVEETYELSPHVSGSKVVHRITYRGFGAAFARARLSARANAAIRKVDAALQKHLAR